MSGGRGVGEPDGAADRRRTRSPRGPLRIPLPTPLTAPGVAVGTALACLALTPSLLPRSPAAQGLVCGIVAAVGYGVGRLGTRVARRATWRPGPHLHKAGRWAVWVLAPLAFALMLTASFGWQREVHGLVGLEPPSGASPLLIVAVTLAVALLLVGVGRLLRAAARRVAGPLGRVLPARVASPLGALAVAVVIGAALDQFVLRWTLAAIDSSFDAVNNEVPPGREPPVTGMRSGGPGSLSPWDELGVQGRRFVSSGPGRADLAETAAGRTVRTPIRVYVGLDSGEDLEELAAVAVRELERTGAFRRAVLCVVTPTGRGWVNQDAAEALEHLYAGDTAIVSMQYSYLPSSLAFLTDPERAREAGRQLFDQVHERWAGLPEDTRPRLLVYGESLGSTGAQAAFSGLGDIRARTDGALFVGPPQSNTLWRELVERRDRGTPQVLPTYDSGLTVRFASDRSDVHRPDGRPWQAPRVLFLQHASDPICWWSPDLLFRRPDWLEEPRGADVSPSMSWYPVVTFAQVTADLAVGNSTPVGHGHRYGDFVRHWAAILPPPGWSDADTDRVAAVLDG
ncbi:alpha/beta hydrolase [Blastococcus sp. PRF04-17]|uniref:alpha/beta hydrolase n=1 Tax=Blastococcus sp. PRF04-17 TaxID=2933797 RepID=UPI001FF1C236|nr:alpha/beta-hydrolase family protein [Blastococcus sp. PRF04-17]UOY02591.1 alpha/beta-hydrolase family protein [Blastococcus sp. PRF04-17]